MKTTATLRQEYLDAVLQDPESRAQLKKLLQFTIFDFEWPSVRIPNVLNLANIVTIGQLVQLTPTELLKLRSFGKVSLYQVQDKLEEIGLSLGMQIHSDML